MLLTSMLKFVCKKRFIRASKFASVMQNHCTAIPYPDYHTLYFTKLVSYNINLPDTFMSIQKHSFPVFVKNRCLWKFPKIQRKTPVLESMFNRVTGWKPGNLLKRGSATSFFLWILQKALEHLFDKTPLGKCFFYLKQMENNPLQKKT